jgi:hypothetical protein
MRGRGSAGRASPCQGEGRGFESRRPLGASLAQSQWGEVFPGGVAERRGNGLQIRVHGFKSRLHLGRLAQWERASLTRKRSLVQIQYRPPASPLVSEAFGRVWRWDRLTCRPMSPYASPSLCLPVHARPSGSGSCLTVLGRDSGSCASRRHHFEVLPVGDDSVRTRFSFVVQPVPAVRAAAVASHPHQPGPSPLR